ncbi:hypothetical protein CK203_036089 [Vitis vinifera]|uniref:Uncharacterized protein n=1 Tax=Vitis vinifera TaxID=29760 RepID=A0A438HQZ8_VITVI|nr:hypothetical protein CK203_036089 [Vitis vinifera]
MRSLDGAIKEGIGVGQFSRLFFVDSAKRALWLQKQGRFVAKGGPREGKVMEADRHMLKLVDLPKVKNESTYAPMHGAANASGGERRCLEIDDHSLSLMQKKKEAMRGLSQLVIEREDGKQLYSIFSFFLIFKFKPKANKALKRKKGHAEEKRGLEVAESPPSPKALSTDRPIPLSFVKNLRPNVEGAQRVKKDRDSFLPKVQGTFVSLVENQPNAGSQDMPTRRAIPGNVRFCMSSLPPPYKGSFTKRNHKSKFQRDLREDKSIRPIEKSLIGPSDEASPIKGQGLIAFNQAKQCPISEITCAGTRGIEEGEGIPHCGLPIQVFPSNLETTYEGQFLDQASDSHPLPLASTSHLDRLVKGGEDVIPVGNSVLSLDNIFVRRKYRPLP